MPADEEQVVGAVCFFQNDDNRSVAVVVCEAQIGEVGGSSVWFVGAIGTDGTAGTDADVATAEEFEDDVATGTGAGG